MASGPVIKFFLNWTEPAARQWWADEHVGSALTAQGNNLDGAYFDCACESVLPVEELVRKHSQAKVRWPKLGQRPWAWELLGDDRAKAQHLGHRLLRWSLVAAEAICRKAEMPPERIEATIKGRCEHPWFRKGSGRPPNATFKA